ncbi:hypothetical protein KSS87_005631 [Heliosperma pusillum]|nr:hypothetical protein KSS87_005631 [Heliosperma pusillum]
MALYRRLESWQGVTRHTIWSNKPNLLGNGDEVLVVIRAIRFSAHVPADCTEWERARGFFFKRCIFARPALDLQGYHVLPIKKRRLFELEVTCMEAFGKNLTSLFHAT